MFDLMYESAVHEPAEPVALKCHIITILGIDGYCISLLIGPAPTPATADLG